MCQLKYKKNLNLTLEEYVEYGIFLKANRIQRSLISSRSPTESLCSTVTDLLEQGTLTLSLNSKSSMISAGQMTPTFVYVRQFSFIQIAHNDN